jgi:hypothetical protein
MLRFFATLATAMATPAFAQADPLLDGGKLLLTNGATSIEGSSGGGLTTWATIAGKETDAGLGLSAHATLAELPDFSLHSHGIAIGIKDRLELSYARQNFDTRDVGTALGLGRGFTFNQHIFGAKLRLIGDVVYGAPLVPQISIGVQHKRNLDAAIVRAVGARRDSDTEFTVSATKLFLDRSLLVNTTMRWTRANQFGLLGFGGDRGAGRSLEFEGSLAYMLSPRLVVGGEYRTKPDNLAIAHEDNAADLFAAYALTRHLTITAALLDARSIATFDNQRGGYLSLQLAF